VRWGSLLLERHASSLSYEERGHLIIVHANEHILKSAWVHLCRATPGDSDLAASLFCATQCGS
jgi:hypothetical protein